MTLVRSRNLMFMVALAAVLLAVALSATRIYADEATDIATGGKLYDKWWTVAPGATAPTGNQALWATQTTNTRSGLDTWRCKECHGWDYKGKDGAYGSGSHKTGFTGVMAAAAAKTEAELVAILKGSTNPNHNFSTSLDNDSITKLAKFLKNGLIDDTKYIDYATKKPIGANATRGGQLYSSGCAGCHSADGTAMNFGSDTSPEYVGTIASDNPWEFLHKIRAGQPGTAMPAAIISGQAIQDVVDILAYAQSLPAKKVAAPAATPTATPSKALPATGDTPFPYLPVAAGASLALLTGAALLRQRSRLSQKGNQ